MNLSTSSLRALLSDAVEKTKGRDHKLNVWAGRSHEVKYMHGKPTDSHICPVCGSQSSWPELRVRHAGRCYTINRCVCATLFYPEATAPNYSLVEDESVFFMRLDQAEGIDAALRPLFVSPMLGTFPVVDVGCGIGFTTDFLAFSGRPVAAFDPSAAAEFSREALGVPIHIGEVSAERIALPRDRLVYASEVIEHVPNPRRFLSMLKDVAGDNGYVLVTTPNADFIGPGANLWQVRAMLGPTQHPFLLPAHRLASLAQEVGFEWSDVWVENERLFLLAGKKPVDRVDSFSRSQYRAFLQSRLEQGRDSELAARAYGYRLFKEYVHSGAWPEAEEVLAAVSREYSKLGFDLSRPARVASQYHQASGAQRRLPDPRMYPFNMPVLLLLIGNFLIGAKQDSVKARPFYESAASLSSTYRNCRSDALQSFDLEVQAVGDWAADALQTHFS